MRRRALNERVLAEALAFPQGGGYRFTPTPRAPDDPTNPRDPDHDGVTRDLRAGGGLVARAAPDGATFCCGVTFEAWFRATAGGAGLGPEALRELVADWFCPVMGHPGAAVGLVVRGLGRRVSVREARPGDLCQFWRSVDLAKPSGHSVVFLSLDGDRLRYWSSQPATGGVGVHTETVGPAWRLHLARALG